ncbi:MAG: radical SAM protein [Clostridiales Family XIII bacterium]|jgi:hypothetical protein|nr:radical SAM protein [Clostridiales Family XIII bacterium]
MSETLKLDKMSLVVTTRCNLRCRLCDEFIPMHKPFRDMTREEELAILDAFFDAVDRVDMLHLSGGGEPFLNPQLPEMIEAAYEYENRFDRFMVFTNGTVRISDGLLNALKGKPKLIVHASDYGIAPERSAAMRRLLADNGVNVRAVRYYGEDPAYGGWVDFGPWEARKRTGEQLAEVFANCGITKHMRGNWRTRDGKVHWCQRSQRGTELGLIADNPNDYVDLFGGESRESKREKFVRIANAAYLSSCDHCSGDHGTEDGTKRFPAGEQMKGNTRL